MLSLRNEGDDVPTLTEGPKPWTLKLKETTGGEFRVYRASIRLLYSM